jgi:hypothetical protein
MTHAEFDATRAMLRDSNTFEPFYVKQTIPLQEALANKMLAPDTELLLLDHPDTPIALIKAQMAYHHVAQGEIAGEPWLVSF